MSSLNIRTAPVSVLRKKWTEDIQAVAEEANYMAIHLLRINAVQKWLWQRPHRRIVNRSMQAHGWIMSLWIPTAHMYIRREVDNQHNTVSLNQIFLQMTERSDAFPELSSAEIGKDRKSLMKQCAGAAEWVNRQVAHRTRWDDAFTGGHFDGTFECINALVRKYYELLVGTPLQFEDLELDPAWLIGFTEPWYKPRKKLRVRFA